MYDLKLILLLAISCLVSCHKDCIEYFSHEVHFYTTHEDYELKAAEFELVTEQALLKPEHQQGAVFTTVTEQYLVKPAYTQYKIADSVVFHLVANAESNSIQGLACYQFYDVQNFEEIAVPAEYKTRFREVLVQQGSGATVPAAYEILFRELLVADAQIIPTSQERSFRAINFRIPNTMTIQEYLNDQFAQQDIEDCIEGRSYRIIE